MEVQDLDQCPNTDQVVLFIDQPDSKPKMSSPPPQQEDSKLEQSPPPQLPDIKDSKTQARTKTLRRLNFSKPKSRFTETNYPPHSKTFPESEEYQPLNPPESATSTDEDDDEEWFESEEEGVDAGEAKKTFQVSSEKEKKDKKESLD